MTIETEIKPPNADERALPPREDADDDLPPFRWPSRDQLFRGALVGAIALTVLALGVALTAPGSAV